VAMEIADTTRFEPAKDIVFTALEDEVVILNLKTRRYFGLNESGVLIWQAVQTGKDVAEMTSSMAEVYDVTAEDAREAVVTFCQELLDAGLLALVTE